MSIPVAARFRAIVAGPLSANPNTSDQTVYEAYGGIRFQDGPNLKRRGDAIEAGPSTPKRVVRSTSEEGQSTRGVCSEALEFRFRRLTWILGGFLQPLILYKGREELLKSLSDRFRQSPHVNFHGTYDIVDAGSTHKARIQSVANDIWKATGYRFTCVSRPKHDG